MAIAPRWQLGWMAIAPRWQLAKGILFSDCPPPFPPNSPRRHMGSVHSSVATRLSSLQRVSRLEPSWLRTISQRFTRSAEVVLEKPASPVIVRCGQYNVLASYLGDNRQPWFLHGLSTLTQDRRSKIIEKFYERDESGRYKNVGWPRWAEELMTAEEQQLVEEEHERHFKWEARKERLLQRIVALDADVLSLVELDRWEDWFAPALKQHGYSSIWCKRPRETSHDGCAVFWRDPFSLIAHKSIEFIDRADPVTGRTYKDRVCIFALLQTTCGQRMLFLSTHLARNPDDPTMDRIRVRETAQLLYALTAFAREHGAIDAPVVMAGDFNTTNFRQLAAAARTLFELSHETVHPFVFNAFAAASQPTSVTACRKMCIDYIFFEPSKLELLEVLDQPALECCKPIPNAEHPSDHLPVLLTMRFRPSAYHQVHLARAWAQMLLSHDGISDVLDESQCSVPPEKRLERPLASTQLDAAFDFFAGSCATHDSIGEEALVARFRSLGSDLAPHAPALVKILREASVPADGEPFPPLSRSTFRDCYLHALRMQERSSRDVQWAFAFFDADGSGRLRHEELRTGFAAVCPFPMSEARLDEIWRACDGNHDGHVSPHEFFDALFRARYGLPHPVSRPLSAAEADPATVDPPHSQ